MYNLKPLSKDAIPAALAKAERYRLLNEPGEAESICLDVLLADPDHREARVTLLLSLTDQFARESSAKAVARATDLAAELPDPYDQLYYSGVVCERRAKAGLHRGGYGAAAAATGWLREAMTFYERAEAVRPAMNDNSILRWNACARLLMELPDLSEHRPEPVQSE